MPKETNTIEAQSLSLGQLFQSFYIVPDWQREYVWTEQEVEQLLEDLLNALYDERRNRVDEAKYFMGSIVGCPADGEENGWTIIDGQQRMTTFHVMLCAMRDCLVSAGEDAPDSLEWQIRAAAPDSTGKDVYRYRVQLQYEDSQGILEAISHGNSPPVDSVTTASAQRITDAYDTVIAFLGFEFKNNPEAVMHFRAAINSSIQIVRIQTQSVADALRVFETINDRGVALDPVDLLKNLLFQKASQKEYGALKERWRQLTQILESIKEKPLRFLRYLILSQYGADTHAGFREEHVYKWFLEHARDCGIADDPLSFADELVSKARIYANFCKGLDPTGVPAEALKNIARLARAVRQHFVLLLASHHLSTPLFGKLCQGLENLLFCYIITRQRTNLYERNFSKWASELRDVNSEEELDNFISQRIIPEMAALSDEFDFALGHIGEGDVFGYRLRYILAKLTQWVELQAWRNDSDQSLERFVARAVWVEHILPQSPSDAVVFDRPDEYDQYKTRLGNLTLLEAPINASMSNAPYAEKRTTYGHSNFLLTKSLAEVPQVGANTTVERVVREVGLRPFDTWDSQGIDDRQEILRRLARLVWDMPKGR